VAPVDTESAGNTALIDAAFHVLDEKHTDRADIGTGAAAGAFEKVNFNSHFPSLIIGILNIPGTADSSVAALLQNDNVFYYPLTLVLSHKGERKQ